MFSDDQLNEMLRQAMAQFASQGQSKEDSQTDSKTDNSSGSTVQGISLTQPQLLVIAGFLAGALQVDSVLVSRDQELQIVLVGSLKKSSMNGMLYQVKSMSFDDLMKMMSGR